MFYETIPYRLSRHPGKVSPDTIFDRSGIEQGSNCQLFVAWAVRALGYYMPDYYRSSEIYEDPEKVLETIAFDTTENIQQGDIIGLWPKNKNKIPKGVHVGIILYENNICKVLHNSRDKNAVTKEPLGKTLERYDSIACIKRPKVMIPSLWNPQALHQLGFYSLQQL